MYLRTAKYLFIFLTIGITPLQGAWFADGGTQPEGAYPALLSLEDSAYTVHSDSLALKAVAAQGDSAALKAQEPLFERKMKDTLEYPIHYKASDSISFSQSEQFGRFYRDGSIEYGTMTLTADTIHLDMQTSTVFAWAGADSAGGVYGAPKFSQGSETFDTRKMSYNFGTRRGVIQNITSTQGEAVIHAEQAKRFETGHVHMINGQLTTCTAECPHFYLHTNKVKVMPENKIIFGFSHLVLEEVPLPVFLPFGLIPNTKKKAVDGLIPPGFGVESTRGMYLTDGGYYFEYNDQIDGTITADIYTQGTWGLKLNTRYNVRYRYNGSADIRYYTNVTGEKGINRTKSKQYSISISHNQDPKANPYRTFSASINYSTTEYDKTFNYTNSRALFTTTKTSSISYRKSWPNSPFRLTANLNHNQSSTDEIMHLSLPVMSFTMDKQYPFRRKEAVGKTRWYEDFGITYSANLLNTIAAKENELFSSQSISKMNSGFSHSIPLSLNLKVLRFININPSVNYKGVLYSRKIHRWYDADYVHPLTGANGRVVTDTIKGLVYGHSASPSLTISAMPKFYLTLTSRKASAHFHALRYVLSPAVSFNFIPDMKGVMPNYYETYTDANGREIRYSIFENGAYGTPSLPGRSGTISIGVNNNLELKIKDTKADSTGTRKVKVFERLNFSTGYNVFADSMNWSMISFNAGINLLPKLSFDFRGTLDPYALDKNGNRNNTTEWKANGRIGRLTNLGFSTSYQFGSLAGGGGPTQGEQGQSSEPVQPSSPAQSDKKPFSYFHVPWSVSIGYDFSYSKPRLRSSIMQTITLTGNIAPTPKWQVNFSSGYDIKAKEITHTSMSITRDLHCWQMSIHFSPFGAYKFYMFQINVRASILQDLKYETRKDRRDFTDWNM